MSVMEVNSENEVSIAKFLLHHEKREILSCAGSDMLTFCVTLFVYNFFPTCPLGFKFWILQPLRYIYTILLYLLKIGQQKARFLHFIP